MKKEERVLLLYVDTCLVLPPLPTHPFLPTNHHAYWLKADKNNSHIFPSSCQTKGTKRRKQISSIMHLSD